MNSLVIGLVLILVGSGGFVASKSMLSVIPISTGAVLAFIGKKTLQNALSKYDIAGVALSIIVMIFTVSAVPGMVKVLIGSDVDRPGDIFVVGVTAILCLVHGTIGIRRLVRNRSRT